MRSTAFKLFLLAGAVSPFTLVQSRVVKRDTPVPVEGNPYDGYTVYLSPPYANKVDAAVVNITDPGLQAKALEVKEVPTIDNDGEAKYKGYIDTIAASIKKYPDLRIIAIIEPDSLPNLVTNLDVPKCQTAEPVYKTLIPYALEQLNTAGVYMYLDAGHAGWLGWPDNLEPAAELYQQVWQNAGSPEFVRGLSTNVANYNAFRAETPDPIAAGNPNYDESHYVEALAALLPPFPTNFIVDQVGDIIARRCNIKGAGFGTRPTQETNSSLVDSIVWVKPGGESDGTTNSSSPRFDTRCVSNASFIPAPEAGEWFQDYFEALVVNSNPAF
ncbi:hypothetical protein VNI00_009519 [Paramarasmius palmivorus]|uniref:Glucanase n=1 Tax=Paramarasmius palmivorus TaxID=297713 RepID=A0AAW0CQC8_9AGAR